MVPCKVREERGDCRYCSFSGFLGGDPEVCCAWRAEAQPDKAIEILEMLLGKGLESGAEMSVEKKIRFIADHYPRSSQMGVAQEECAELIQAISKVRRLGINGETLDHMAEEIADVRIMCAQLVVILGLNEAVSRNIDQKLDRQMKRIMKGDTAYETTCE